jgi:hypothetical protein
MRNRWCHIKKKTAFHFQCSANIFMTIDSRQGVGGGTILAGSLNFAAQQNFSSGISSFLQSLLLRNFVEKNMYVLNTTANYSQEFEIHN